MLSQGGLHLSKKDLMTFRVIEEYRQGRLSREEAAQKLGVSQRTITRKAKAIRERGIEALGHGNRGREPVNKSACSVKD